MSAVAKHKPTEVVAATNEAPMFSMIERIMADPSLPIERIEQAFSFYQKVQADAARKDYFAAFARMQPSLPIIDRKGKSHNAKYGRWEDIVEQIMPVLLEHGFGISFRVAEAQNNRVQVTCLLMHKGGHAEETSFPYPFDGSGSKNPIQAIGSATSYGKRYTASVLLNIVTKNEDDDGNAASGNGAVTDEQVVALVALADDVGADKARFCKFMNVTSFAEIRAKDFAKAKALLSSKGAR